MGAAHTVSDKAQGFREGFPIRNIWLLYDEARCKEATAKVPPAHKETVTRARDCI